MTSTFEALSAETEAALVTVCNGFRNIGRGTIILAGMWGEVDSPGTRESSSSHLRRFLIGGSLTLVLFTDPIDKDCFRRDGGLNGFDCILVYNRSIAVTEGRDKIYAFARREYLTKSGEFAPRIN